MVKRPKLVVREANARDVGILASTLREADRLEAVAVHGGNAEDALFDSFESSCRSYVATVNNVPVAMFGTVTLENEPWVGRVWLMAADAFTDHPRQILKEGPEWLRKLTEGFRVVGNYVDARNYKHLTWTLHLGFKIVRLVEDYGKEKRPFYEIVKVV